MNEFSLIHEILAELGSVARGKHLRLGAGDDACVTSVPTDCELVSSIDTLVGGVHFPIAARPELVGYRAMMVSVSDLAAMGAEPSFVLVALTLERADVEWVRALTRGMARAAAAVGIAVAGGNLARGALALSLSVHGHRPAGSALLRSGAHPDDRIYVTGALGAAAAALARGHLERYGVETRLDDLSRAYYLPQARVAAGIALRGVATSLIDVSDGLLQDLGHVCAASGVGAELIGERVPVAAGATLTEALTGGDDYELCFTARGTVPELSVPATAIGRIVAGSGVRVDGTPTTAAAGYQHF